MRRTLTALAGDASRPTAFLLGAQGFVAASALLVSVLAASVMPPAARGDLALWLQMSYLGATIALLGLERPVTAHSEGALGGVVSLVVRLAWPGLLLVAAIGAGGLVWYAAGTASSSVPMLVALGSLYATCGVAARAVRVGFIVSHSWRPYVVTTVLTQACIVLGAVLLAGYDVSDVTLWTAAYAAAALITAIHIVILVRRARTATVTTDVSQTTLRATALRLLPASLGNTAMLRADRLLLPLLSSSRELGLYVMVATATEIASWPIQHYVDSSLRAWRKRRRSRAERRRLILAGLGLGALFAAAAGAVAWLIISLWLPDYDQSLRLILPLAVGAALYSASRVQQGLLIAAGRPRAASTVEVTGMSVAVLFYVLAIPPFGALGAAWASVVAYGLTVVAGVLVARARPEVRL